LGLSYLLGCRAPETISDDCSDLQVQAPEAMLIGEGGLPRDDGALTVFDRGAQMDVYVGIELESAAAGRCFWVSARLYDREPETGTRRVFATSEADADLSFPGEGPTVIGLRFPNSVAELSGGELYLDLRLIPDVGPPLTTSIASVTPVIAGPEVASPEVTLGASCDAWGEDLAGELLEPDEREPYGPQRPAEFVVGFQGATMITPRLALDNHDGLESTCAILEMVVLDPNSARVFAATSQAIELSDTDGRLLSEPIFLPFSTVEEPLALASTEVYVGARVGSRRVRARVRVPLVDNE